MASRSDHLKAITAAINAAIADDYYLEFTVSKDGGQQITEVSLDIVGVHGDDPKTPDFDVVMKEDWQRL